MAKISGWLLAASLVVLAPQAASADSRIYNVVPFGAPAAAIYDRGEGLFYRVPPYDYSRYYGLDPYAWHYRNAGRYGQPYRQAWQGRLRPRTFYYVPPSAAVYHRAPDAAAEPPDSVPSTPAPKLKSPQQKEPDVQL